MYRQINLVSPKFGFEIKGKQRSKAVSALLTILHSIRSVYILRMFAVNIVRKFRFLGSFTSQDSKFLANFPSKHFSLVRSKCKNE